jgi:hypothetical protein
MCQVGDAPPLARCHLCCDREAVGPRRCSPLLSHRRRPGTGSLTRLTLVVRLYSKAPRHHRQGGCSADVGPSADRHFPHQHPVRVAVVDDAQRGPDCAADEPRRAPPWTVRSYDVGPRPVTPARVARCHDQDLRDGGDRPRATSPSNARRRAAVGHCTTWFAPAQDDCRCLCFGDARVRSAERLPHYRRRRHRAGLRRRPRTTARTTAPDTVSRPSERYCTSVR